MSRINLNLTPQMLANLATQASASDTAISSPNASNADTANSSASANQSATTPAGADRYENPDLAIQGRIRSDFQNRFASLAQDRDRFHALFAKVYGSHDTGAAERLRRRTLSGDTSWLPKIQFVPRSQIRGANGAYSAQKGTVYLAGDLRNNPNLAARTFSEEVGHHIDTKVKSSDTPGDEGELFRRLLHGEQLSGAQVAAIKSENDHGVVNINGQNVEVEFFLKKLKKSFKKVTRKIGNTVKRAVSTVTKPIRKGFQAVTNVAKKVTGKVVNLARGAVRGIANGVKKVFRTATGLIKRPLSAALGLAKSVFRKATGWIKRPLSAALSLAKKVFDLGSGLGRSILGPLFSRTLGPIFGSVFGRLWSFAGGIFR